MPYWNNVEHSMGHVRFVLFYLLFGLAFLLIIPGVRTFLRERQ